MLQSAALLWVTALGPIAFASASAQPHSGFSEIARYLHHRAADGVILDKHTSINSALEDFTLFKYSNEVSTKNGSSTTTLSKGVEIVCTKCYVLGSAQVKLTSSEPFNTTQFTQSTANAFNETFREIKKYTSDLASEIKAFVGDSFDAISHLDLESLQGFHLPAPQIDFNIPVNAPDTKLQINFQDLDVYAELGVVLSSSLTYKLNLYTSKSLLGAKVGSVLVGVVVNLDLILSTETEVDLSTGFHIKLDRALIDITLFADEASHIDFRGGKFDFLPVTIETSSVVLKAVLRLGVQTGFTVGIDYSQPVEILNHTMSDLKLMSGIEASVYANIAEFTTNVTAADMSDDQNQCKVSVEQGYQFAIGAAAGASVQLFDHIWGPVPKTEIPLYYTSLKPACITPKTQSPAPTPILKDRADLSTTTTKTQYTYSALGCASQLINCPASLMTLSTNIIKTTLTTSVLSGADVVWTVQQAQTTRAVPVEFGANAVTIAPSSGKPTSFVPTPTTSPKSVGDVISGSTGGVNNKLIIGLSVGLGVPVLVAITAAVIFFHRRRKSSDRKGAAESETLVTK